MRIHRRLRRRCIAILSSILTLIVAGELISRFVLGLGSPPLTITHDTIEYLFKPDQDVMRFGNRQLYNRYSMRSDDFEKKNEDELRVIIFGDSVLNGGSLTDHRNLATTLLRQQLETFLKRRVTVLHVSAGSWGPENWLAYAEEYGFFSSDLVILLISSHDLNDHPTFSELNPLTHPQEPPLSALWEGLYRYLPRYLPALRPRTNEDLVSKITYDISSLRGSAAVEKFLRLAASTGAQTVVALFPERRELKQRPPAFAEIARVASSANAKLLDLLPTIKKAVHTNKPIYRDNIHLSSEGQLALANAFFHFIISEPAETAGYGQSPDNKHQIRSQPKSTFGP